MRKTKSEAVNAEHKAVLILHDDARQHHHLVKVNRYLMLTVTVLMALVMLLGFLLAPQKDPLDSVKVSPIQLQQANPGLSAEINVLKGQVAGLVSGSIESKLRVLEDSIRAGSVNNALGTIQDLKRDVRMLQGYTDSPVAKAPAKVASEILLEEVSHLKNLIYLTLASVSLMFAAIAGIWANRRYRLTQQRRAYLQQNKQ